MRLPRNIADPVRLALHAGTLLVALVGALCLGDARRSMSGTFDEANHLATGLEWWQFGTYTQWTENPPLARVMVAALPYFHGMRLPEPSAWDPKTHEWNRTWEIGTDLLYEGDGFESNLGRARFGTLPFFLLALFAVWGLADGRERPGAGLIAVTLTATFPALVAHGALATTDVAFVGTFLCATLALKRWFERPTPGRVAALAACFGLALLTKFSTLVFFPIAIAAFVLARLIARRRSQVAVRPQRDGVPLAWLSLVRQLGVMIVLAFVVTWAGYRFSFGAIGNLAPVVKGWLQLLPPPEARGFLFHVPLPMPEFFHGLRFLAAHDAVGHDAYLLGKVSEHGFVFFYPLALLVKTPLPFLLLLVLWVAWLVRERGVAGSVPSLLGPVFAALGILVVASGSHVNLGIRHVFVVVPLLGVGIAGVCAQALDRSIARSSAAIRQRVIVMLGTCLLAQVGIVVASRGHTLAYFNALAGSDPARILLDSDLDWGQDLYALRKEVRARGIERLTIGYFGMLRLCRHQLPPLTGLVPGKPTTGWIAISENYFRHRSTFMLLKYPCDPKSTYKDGEVQPLPFAWLANQTPVAMAGVSIRLYFIPEPPIHAGGPAAPSTAPDQPDGLASQEVLGRIRGD